MAHQLGQPIEEKMLQYTCAALEKAFGVRPRSYRGGRWSLGGDSVRSLHNAGILIDSTVTPGRSWCDPQHPLLDGADYQTFPRHPFYLRVDAAGPHADGGDILELPVGASYVKPAWPGSVGGAIGRLTRKVHNLLGRPHGWLWLRPTSMTRTQLRACLELLRRDRVPVWVAIIHSSEIIPCRPCPSEAAVKQFIQRCLYLVEDAVSLGATCATLDEVRLRLGANLASTPP
jgi:hypothetical protein